MDFPNRRQRRQWAKQSGFLGKKRNSTDKERIEMNRRAAEVGKQIHHANMERELRKEEEERIRKETEMMNPESPEKETQND